MAKLPYGGIDFSGQYDSLKPWELLEQIQVHLEAGEPIPPFLAWHLGDAIRFSKRDSKEFLRRLGLKRGRGRPKRISHHWYDIGLMVEHLLDDGLTKDQALDRVIAMTMTAEGEETISSTRIQDFHNEYLFAKREHDESLPDL